jgi:hypothetical protein
LQKILTGNAPLTCGLLVCQAELPLEYSVDTAHLLLFTQLSTVFGQARIFLLAVLTGRIGSALYPTLVGEAFFAFQKQLFAFTAALTALCI